MNSYCLSSMHQLNPVSLYDFSPILDKPWIFVLKSFNYMVLFPMLNLYKPMLFQVYLVSNKQN